MNARKRDRKTKRCTHCYKQCNTFLKFEQHVCGTLKCSKCNFKATTKKSLAAHQREHKKPKVQEPKTWKCAKCTYIATSRQSHNSHMRVHCAKKAAQESSPPPGSPEMAPSPPVDFGSSSGSPEMESPPAEMASPLLGFGSSPPGSPEMAPSPPVDFGSSPGSPEMESPPAEMASPLLGFGSSPPGSPPPEMVPSPPVDSDSDSESDEGGRPLKRKHRCLVCKVFIRSAAEKHKCRSEKWVCECGFRAKDKNGLGNHKTKSKCATKRISLFYEKHGKI